MSAFLDSILYTLFPHRCFLCNEVILPRQRLCADCVKHAPYVLPPICEICGRSAEHCICGGHSRHYERCVSPFYHKDAAKSGILELKENNYAYTIEGFAAEMAEVIRREYGGIPFDLITSVPLHRKDLRARGFDQAASLAKALSERVGIPYVPTLTKLTYTDPQKELTAILRRGNLLGVFDVTADVAERVILLVDDVITTGSTLDECAKMLKLYGAAEVYAVTAAAAVLQKTDK